MEHKATIRCLKGLHKKTLPPRDAIWYLITFITLLFADFCRRFWQGLLGGRVDFIDVVRHFNDVLGDSLGLTRAVLVFGQHNVHVLLSRTTTLPAIQRPVRLFLDDDAALKTMFTFFWLSHFRFLAELHLRVIAQLLWQVLIVLTLKYNILNALQNDILLDLSPYCGSSLRFSLGFRLGLRLRL